MRGVFYALVIAILFTGCTTTNRSAGITPADVWADANLVAEQRATIEQQQRHIDRMVELVERGVADLREARTVLSDAQDAVVDFGGWLRRVDAFVRRIIEIESGLETIQ